MLQGDSLGYKKIWKKTAVVIGGKTAMAKVKDALLERYSWF